MNSKIFKVLGQSGGPADHSDDNYILINNSGVDENYLQRYFNDQMKTGGAKSDIQQIVAQFLGFKESFNEFLLWNFYSIYAILMIINQFDFYLIKNEKKQDYLQELLTVVKASNQIKFIGEERQSMARDKHIIQDLLPHTFKCGYFVVELSSIKKILIEKIDQNMARIDEALCQKLNSCILKNKQTKQEIKKILLEEPNTVYSYIHMKQFMLDIKLKAKICGTEQNQKLISLIFQTILNNFISIDMGLFELYIRSSGWLIKIQNLLKSTQKKLIKYKNQIRNDIISTVTDIKNQFHQVQIKINNFPKNFDVATYENIQQNLNQAKEIEDMLVKLINQSAEINRQQTVLQFEQSDFASFKKQLTQFQKHIDFWEFCQKWYAPSPYPLFTHRSPLALPAPAGR